MGPEGKQGSLPTMPQGSLLFLLFIESQKPVSTWLRMMAGYSENTNGKRTLYWRGYKKPLRCGCLRDFGF